MQVLRKTNQCVDHLARLGAKQAKDLVISVDISISNQGVYD